MAIAMFTLDDPAAVRGYGNRAVGRWWPYVSVGCL